MKIEYYKSSECFIDSKSKKPLKYNHYVKYDGTNYFVYNENLNTTDRWIKANGVKIVQKKNSKYHINRMRFDTLTHMEDSGNTICVHYLLHKLKIINKKDLFLALL